MTDPRILLAAVGLSLGACAAAEAGSCRALEDRYAGEWEAIVQRFEAAAEPLSDDPHAPAPESYLEAEGAMHDLVRRFQAEAATCSGPKRTKELAGLYETNVSSGLPLE